MAGEIEEPFRFNFQISTSLPSNGQADLLHTGSISFGRFESESLSWERRSSFSHNRYLEEVEKYSKPGTVTEKKAYFEAHFRRKALLKQSSSECQDDPHDLDESKNTCDAESPHTSDHSKYDEETEVQKYEKENVKRLYDYTENGNESSHVTSFHESPLSLGYDEDGKICESMINTIDHLVSGTEHFKLEETHQSGIENVILVKSEENGRVKLNDMVLMVDLASKANDSSLTSHTADKEDDNASAEPQKMSPTVRPTSEIKRTKLKPKDHANVAQIRRTISSETSNGSTKAKTRESEGLLMKEKEKRSSRPPSPITRSGRKTSKPEESSMSFSKAKILPPKKSIMNEFRSEKTVEAKSSASKKSLLGANQTVNRAKQTISPSKPHINQGAAGFNFKSDQRAERRKEEKKAADMMQLRKSLNFKATPMPSFYNESARCSDQNKVISTCKTPNKQRTPSAGPSRPTPSSSPSSTNRTCPSTPLRKSHGPEKRVQENKNDTSSQKQKRPEPTKGPHSKELKGVHMSRGSNQGHLAVGIAT